MYSENFMHKKCKINKTFTAHRLYSGKLKKEPDDTRLKMPK